MCVGHTSESLISLLKDERRDWRAWWTPIRGPRLKSKGTGPLVQSPSSVLSSNQKLLLPVSSVIQSPHRVSVSFIPFNCKRYVCGLRVRRRPDYSEVVSEVGMCLPATEEHFDIDDGDTMESLLVCSVMDWHCRAGVPLSPKRSFDVYISSSWLPQWVDRCCHGKP